MPKIKRTYQLEEENIEKLAQIAKARNISVVKALNLVISEASIEPAFNQQNASIEPAFNQHQELLEKIQILEQMIDNQKLIIQDKIQQIDNQKLTIQDKDKQINEQKQVIKDKDHRINDLTDEITKTLDKVGDALLTAQEETKAAQVLHAVDKQEDYLLESPGEKGKKKPWWKRIFDYPER